MTSHVAQPVRPAPSVPAHERPWARHGLALIAPVAAGLACALVMPRGPVTSAQALLALFLGAAAGLIAGWVGRSRWTMLTAPLAALVVVEIGRLGLEGLTVSVPRLDAVWGWVAFLSGRGVHGVLAGLPIAVFAAIGAGIARRGTAAGETGRRWARYARRGVTGVLVAGLVALGVAVARPASTPPILGPDGERLPGSVAELVKIPVGGHDQWLSVRGADADDPVLLYLEGGPGWSSIGSSRVVFSELEQDFVVAVYDQRGAGKSYGAIDPVSTHTLRQAVADTTEVADYLRRRFDERKIYLLGESWGSTLGVLAAQASPDRFHAFIGSGQMVSQRASDGLLYDDMLAYAARTGDDELAATMRGFGRPPYADPLAYATIMGYYELLEPYDDPAPYVELASRPGNDVGFMGLKAPEYSLIEKVNIVRGLIDTFGVIYPQLMDIDFRKDVTSLDVPVYVLLGDHELDARAALVPQWLDTLSAPRVVLEHYPDSAHTPHAQEYQRFHTLMVDTVVPQTYDN